MGIISFRRSANADKQPSLRTWSQQEMAEFYRAHRLLAQNGAHIGMDLGISDAGDPWMVFFDLSTQDVFIHIARIGNKCILVCETLGIHLTSETIIELTVLFDERIRSIVSVREEKNNNIVMHPASRIIMAISAVFLLSKLEDNGAAHAKSFDADLSGTGDSAAKRQEGATASRVHAVIGRLCEVVDAPLPVAVLASALLTHELMNVISHPLIGEGVESRGGSWDELQHHDNDIILMDASSHDKMAPRNEAQFSLEHSYSMPVETPVAPTTHVETLTIRMDERQEAAAINSFQAATTRHFDVAMLPAQRPLTSQIFVASQADEEKHSSTGASDATIATAAEKIVHNLVSEYTADHQEGKPPASPANVVGGSEAAGGDSIGGISLGTLDKLGDIVGLFRETHVSGPQLTDALTHFLNLFVSADIEYTGDGVLIEQQHTADLNANMVGIWTNIMPDGSEIAVVGQFDVVHDIANFVA